MENTEIKKTGKNCLLLFRNKKINLLDAAEGILNGMSTFGYYFDRVSYIDYGNSEEIVRAIKDGKENYDNIFILCPKVMEHTLKKFVSNLYGFQFDELGILRSGKSAGFMLFSDK